MSNCDDLAACDTTPLFRSLEHEAARVHSMACLVNITIENKNRSVDMWMLKKPKLSTCLRIVQILSETPVTQLLIVMGNGEVVAVKSDEDLTLAIEAGARRFRALSVA